MRLKPAVIKVIAEIGENDTIIANSYYCIGSHYSMINEADSAICYISKEIRILQNLYGNEHVKVAWAHYTLGNICKKFHKYDLAEVHYREALNIKINLYGENDIRVDRNYFSLGSVYIFRNEYDLSLKYHTKALELRINEYGKKNGKVARSYAEIALVYDDNDKFTLALHFLKKALEIFLDLYGETDYNVAMCYTFLADAHADKDELDLALINYKKSLDIFKDLFGEQHRNIARCYNNIGTVYAQKNEPDLAFEYYQKALFLVRELYGEKNKYVARSYNNIGSVYAGNSDYETALEYHFKAKHLYEELYEQQHAYIAFTNNKIGSVYNARCNYDLALEYHKKALEVNISLLGTEHGHVATNYNNIGDVYQKKQEYTIALEYHIKALEIFYANFGKKHSRIASTFQSIGILNEKMGNYDLALNSYQQAISANTKDRDTPHDIYSVPDIGDYLSGMGLLNAIQSRAAIMASHYDQLTLNKDSCLNLALSHFQICDTLRGEIRVDIHTESDKITLGVKASQIYGQAINVCKQLAKSETIYADFGKRKYNDLAFGFCDKNKMMVLMESLAAVNAKKFAGISQSFLDLENKLSSDITSCKQILAENPDSLSMVLYQNKLFDANRSYDSLILVFEQSYPKYYELKYKKPSISVSQVQKAIDNNSAMLDYFMGDSSITIFTITKNHFVVSSTPIAQNFDTIIQDFCYYGLAYHSSPQRFANLYKRTAFDLYQKLIPDDLDENINKLVVIPDNALGILPFETLLSEKPDTQNWMDLPFLIRNFNISYAYSANLYCNAFLNDTLEETEPVNDWIAMAPVFDDNTTLGSTFETQQLIQDIYAGYTDTVYTHSIVTRDCQLRELPGTEHEVLTIFQEFEKKNLRARIKSRKHANEEFVKSGELKNYKFVHFATHGLLNTEKPELSGLFLSQDTLSHEDCVLYASEIYNLDLNAELIVLSACETGLGKFSKGEGHMGLSRAFLYAGANNLIISLWKVPDNSTSSLMIDFYTNLLDSYYQEDFSENLRQAKIKMINEGTYAHPYYWSSFIIMSE